MKIGFDGVLLSDRNAGSLRYFEQLVDALSQFGSEHIYTFYAQPLVLDKIRQFSSPLSSFVPAPYGKIVPGAIRQQLFFASRQPQVEILHSPVFIPPLAYKFCNVKTVMSVLDLTYRLYPETQKWTNRFWWRLLGSYGVKTADHLIAISRSTRQNMLDWLDTPPEKITVIYPYVSQHFYPDPRAADVAARYALPDKYLLYVGTLEPRKNIKTLLHAFAKACKRSSFPHILVLAGKPGWSYQEILQLVERLELTRRVTFLGYVPDEHLPALYTASDLFIFPSKYEGFGFPVLEAMSCGVPVLSSNASSLPEIVGEAGVMVSPDDVESMAAQIVRLVTDRDLHAMMRLRGFKQASRFSPQCFAKETLAVYEHILT